jgi:hypothetical protein
VDRKFQILFKVLPRYFVSETKNSHENFRSDYLGVPKYEAGVPTARPGRSLNNYGIPVMHINIRYHINTHAEHSAGFLE